MDQVTTTPQEKLSHEIFTALFSVEGMRGIKDLRLPDLQVCPSL